MGEQERLQRAKQKVESLKAFYNHLFVYVVVNLALFVINIVTSPQSLWFYWVTIFWGIGLVLHAASTFWPRPVLGKEWEQKKIKEFMENDDEGDSPSA